MLLIGAGIGVTPFASILKTMYSLSLSLSLSLSPLQHNFTHCTRRYRIEAQQATGQMDIPITKAYFYWVSERIQDDSDEYITDRAGEKFV